MGGRLELKASLLGAELGRQPAGAGAAGGLSPLGPSCPQHLSRQCLRPPREGAWWQHSLLCTVHLLSFPFSVAFGFGAAGLSGHLALFCHHPPRATPVHPLWVPPMAAVSRMPIPVSWDDALSGLPTPPAHLQTLPLLRPGVPCSPGPPSLLLPILPMSCPSPGGLICPREKTKPPSRVDQGLLDQRLRPSYRLFSGSAPEVLPGPPKVT